MSSRRYAAPLAGALAASLLSGLLAGCGGSDSSDEPGQGGTPEPTSSGATASDTATPDPTEPTDPTAYLPTPDDVELTPPGTALRYRQGAFAAWEPRQDLVGVVGLKVLKVQRTTVKKSLRGFDLDATERASTPYFVTSLVGNGGDTDLGGRQLPLYVVDTEGRLVPPTGVDPGFDACPGSVLPAIFAPGDNARSCLIFLVPDGAELDSVMFRPPEGVVPITWTGPAKQPAARGQQQQEPPTTRGSGRKGG